jgi:hypothetical protein
VRAALLAFGAAAAAALAPARPAAAQAPARFFRTDTVFEMMIRTDLRALFRDRDTTGVPWREGTVTWADSAGTRTVPVQARTRGVFRLRTCDVPPIRLRFQQDSVRGTALSGLRRPKLATHCMNSASGEQNTLHEYALYRVLQLFTPWSYQVRLARVTYEDVNDRVRPQTRWAFLIEDPERFAERMQAVPDTNWGQRMGRLVPEHAALLGVFQYFIANTDWSMPGMHNVDLYRRADTLWAVAYDFDWSGTIDASYARPDPRLRTRTVRQRVYRGVCQNPETIEPVLLRFLMLRDSIAAVYRAVPGLEPRIVDRALRYYDEFYREIEDPRRFAQNVVRPTCLAQ